MGIKKVGLFGTRIHDAGTILTKYSGMEITLIVPDLDNQGYIHEKYMSELVNGIFWPKRGSDCCQSWTV